MQSRALGLVMAALVLVACGGGEIVGGGTTDADTRTGELGPDAEPYVDAIAETMLADDDRLPVDEGSATCMATAIIDLIDAGVLVEAGISPQDLVAVDRLRDLDIGLPDDAARELAAGIAECGLAEPMQDGLVEEFGAEAGEALSPEAVTCLEETVDDQAVGEAMAAALIDGSEEGGAALASDALVGCPEVMTDIVVAGASGPVAPDDEACIHDVIEANSYLVEAAIVDQGSTAGQELGILIGAACPSFIG